jgi:hypothetical protein
MRETIKRRATDYLQVGDVVTIPEDIPCPIIYTEECPYGKTVRSGRIHEKLAHGALSVEFPTMKFWDFSNKEALRFSRYL